MFLGKKKKKMRNKKKLHALENDFVIEVCTKCQSKKINHKLKQSLLNMYNMCYVYIITTCSWFFFYFVIKYSNSVSNLCLLWNQDKRFKPVTADCG